MINFEKSFLDLAARLKFEETESIKRLPETGNYLVRGKIDNRDVLIKTVSSKNVLEKKKLDKQVLVDKVLVSINTGHILISGEEGSLKFIVREFISGEPISFYGDVEDATLFGYDQIKDKVLVQAESIGREIIKNILLFLSIPIGQIENNIPENYRRKRFSINLENITEISEISGLDLGRVVDFYEHNKHVLNRNVAVSIGDLSPSNIIFTGETVSLIDFEWLSLDNKMMDISFLWLFLWRYPDWQKKLTDKFVLDEADELDFQVCLIRQVFNCGWHERFRKYKQENMENHKWYKYLKNSASSFNALLSL